MSYLQYITAVLTRSADRLTCFVDVYTSALTALSACLLSVNISPIINDQSVYASLFLPLLSPHLSPRHNSPLCVFLLCLTINTEVLCPPVIITLFVLLITEKFSTVFL